MYQRINQHVVHFVRTSLDIKQHPCQTLFLYKGEERLADLHPLKDKYGRRCDDLAELDIKGGQKKLRQTYDNVSRNQ